jgi:imidazole glycerol-phosphate synthase subunit HisF
VEAVNSESGASLRFPIEIPERTHRPRIIPVLLLHRGQLYKTVEFRDPKYVGDPRNAVRIFNDLGADELVLLDIDASRERRAPNLELIEEIVSEAFMPVGYGGGIADFETVRRILRLGVEKIVLCTAAAENSDLISESSRAFGAQSVVACIDVRRQRLRGHQCFIRGARERLRQGPAELARAFVEAGAGEILVNSIDRDGTFAGYDLDLVREVVSEVSVPVIACGGSESYEDLARVVHEAGASAAAAGSLFVFQRPHRAVLITFPTEAERAVLFPEAELPPRG